MTLPTTWLRGLGQRLAIGGAEQDPTSIGWNFASGVTAAFNANTGYWDLTVAGGGGGGGGGHTIQEEGSSLTQRTVLNFVGANVTVTDTGGKTQVSIPAIALSGSGVTGTLPVGKGGTGLTALGTALQVLRTKADLSGLEWASSGSSITAGNGLTDTAGTFSVDAADATLVVGASGVKRAPITGDVTIPDGSNTAAIANDAVTTAKILDSNVTTAKIADNAVTNAKIPVGANVDGSKISPAFTAPVTITPPVATSGNPRALVVAAANHTGLPASTELRDVYLDLARVVQFSTGAITAQRAFAITQPSYAFVGASVISDAATLWVGGAPGAGTNATITRSNAIWVGSGFSRFDGGIRAGGQDVASVGQLQTTASFAWYARNSAGLANSRVASYGEAATDTVAIGDDTVLIEATEIASGRNVVFLCKKTAGSTADMPSATGDGVIHLYKAATEPSTGSPANGLAIWSSITGDLRTKSPGTGFKDLASSGVMNERHYEGTVTTTSTSASTVLDIDTSGFGADVSGIAEITLTARGVAGASGVAQRHTCSFTRTGGTLDGPGSLTLNGGATTTGTPTVNNIGANFRLQVTPAAATKRRWDAHVKLMFSNTDAV
jgi:hypothetical protein